MLGLGIMYMWLIRSEIKVTQPCKISDCQCSNPYIINNYNDNNEISFATFNVVLLGKRYFDICSLCRSEM